MGQRLNIEIKSGETTLFNCYYHWAGYTDNALELTKIALSVYDKKPHYLTDYYNMAVKMLLATGANFNRAEHRAYWSYVKDYNKQMESSPLFSNSMKSHELKPIRYNKNVNRNDGLISFTSLGIKETRDWEEARVTIDLATETIDFDAIIYLSDEDYDNSEYYDKNNIANLDFNLSRITFDDFDSFDAQLNKNHQFASSQKDIYNQYISYIE